jgi:probable phosphoglycerate mutase
MTGIWLIRHGEAEGNLYRRIHGWYDGALTEMGFRQLPFLAQRFQHTRLDAVYASDLRRAVSTAQALAEPRGLRVNCLPELREVNMGDWEDRCWGWVERFCPEQYRRLNGDPWTWSVPGGEPGEATARRLHAALLRIAEQQPDRETAVVSHGSAIRLLLAELLGCASSDIARIPYCDNTAVARILAEDGVLRLESWNDNSHLPDELSAFHRDEWWKNPDGKDGRDLYYLPMELESPRGAETYLRRYREAWIASYGSDAGFTGIHLEGARYRRRKDPESVLEVWCEETPCGLLELAPDQGAAEGVGHIALLQLDEAFRGRGLAVQLLGAAVSYYRSRGRKMLRLRVSAENAPALRFYRRWGFRTDHEEAGTFGDTYVMLREIP